jgi:predicted metal-dependent hydrolase
VTYTLIRQSRKTIGLYIKEDGIEVRAPHKMPKTEIDRFVVGKEKWITKKIADMQERTVKKQEFTICYGSMLLWRGKEYPLLGDSISDHMLLDEKGFHFPPDLDEDTLKYNVIRLYKVYAKNHLVERTSHFAEVMGCYPNNIRVTEAKTRWGSCSKKVPGKTKNFGSLPQMMKNINNNTGNPLYNINYS